MPGSSFGNLFRVHTFGESHGPGLGAIVDGCPAGLFLEEKDIQKYLDRRKPGQSNISTPRKEADQVEILSGVFEGQTTGTPIAMLVRNTSQKSKDYSALANCYRPGHADFTFDEKFAHRDYRGGGRSSGRETIGRVAAGAIAAKLLSELNIRVMAYTKSIGPVEIDPAKFNEEAILNTPTAMPDEEASAEAEVYLKKCMEEKDSAGGVIECKVFGLPAGIGEPVFDKLDANLAKAVMSIGAVKAVEIGDGVKVAAMHGSENNDLFMTNEEEYPEIADRIPIIKKTNHSGGTLGGISDGSQLILRAYVKPTPSIFRPQQTVDTDGENIEITIKGRHDPVIVPRAVVVVESMVALTVADLLLMNMGAQMEHVLRVYNS